MIHAVFKHAVLTNVPMGERFGRAAPVKRRVEGGVAFL